MKFKNKYMKLKKSGNNHLKIMNITNIMMFMNIMSIMNTLNITNITNTENKEFYMKLHTTKSKILLKTKKDRSNQFKFNIDFRKGKLMNNK